MRFDQTAIESRWRRRRAAGGVRHRPLELLDRGRQLDDDLDEHRPEALSDDDEQGGFALRGQSATRVVRGEGHGIEDQSLTRGYPDFERGEDPVVPGVRTPGPDP